MRVRIRILALAAASVLVLSMAALFLINEMCGVGTARPADSWHANGRLAHHGWLSHFGPMHWEQCFWNEDGTVDEGRSANYFLGVRLWALTDSDRAKVNGSLVM